MRIKTGGDKEEIQYKLGIYANQGLKFGKIENQALRFYNINWKGKNTF